MSEHVLASFRALFPPLRGGLYVVENLQTSCWPCYVATTGT